MSFLARTAQIFSAFGVGATIPLSTTFSKDQVKEIKDLDTRKVSQETPLPIKEPESEPKQKDLQPKEVMEKIAKMLENEKGEPSCFWLPERGRMRLEFLMCVYKNELETPILFHYDTRNQLGEGRQVKRIEQITFSNGETNMRFKDWGVSSVTGSSKLYLTTLFRKRDITLTPERQCKVEKKGRDHELTCLGEKVGNVDLEVLHKNKHQTLSR